MWKVRNRLKPKALRQNRNTTIKGTIELIAGSADQKLRTFYLKKNEKESQAKH